MTKRLEVSGWTLGPGCRRVRVCDGGPSRPSESDAPRRASVRPFPRLICGSGTGGGTTPLGRWSNGTTVGCPSLLTVCLKPSPVSSHFREKYLNKNDTLKVTGHFIKI